MTREEFSKHLLECREETQCSKNELCRRTGLSFQQLQRLENASNNFSIDNALLYLKKIGYGLYTSKKGKSKLFDNRANFSKHFREYWIDTQMTIEDFADFAGIALGTVAGILYNTKNTSIDSILLCLEKLDCKIEIKKL